MLPGTAFYTDEGVDENQPGLLALLDQQATFRLAKRHDALSLRTLREQGARPERLRAA